MRRREVTASRESATPLLRSFRAGSSHHHQLWRGSGVSDEAVLDLWEEVLHDDAKEAREGPRSPLSLAYETPAAPGTATASLRQSEEIVAKVLHRKKQCIMTYQVTEDKLKVVRVAAKPGAKNKTILYVPMHAVLNIETPEERDRRQRLQVVNDGTTQMNLNNGKHPADRYLCSFAETDGETLVHEHSRVNTVGSLASTGISNGGSHAGANARDHPGLGVPDGDLRSHGGGVGAPGSCASGEATRLLPTRYFIHFTRIEKSGAKKSIHTMEIAVGSDARDREVAFAMAKAMLRRVYLSGPKRLIVFISPKSGTGQGREVFHSQVKPFLHFSRHTLSTIMTRRARDAEDHLADLDHYMDGNYVVVAVGGDGMMHEVVNGLLRRKRQLLGIIRAECRRRTQSRETHREAASREPFTPAHSAETDLVVMQDGVAGDEGEEGVKEEEGSGTRSVIAEQWKKRSRHETGTTSAGESAGRKTADAEERAEGDGGATTHALTAQTGGNEEEQQQEPRQLVHAASKGQKGRGLSGARGGSVHRATASLSSTLRTRDHQQPSAASFAAHVTDVFLTRGWEGLIPMTATVPTGSACGLAKSLDVLSVTEAAIALVHLSSCPEDLLNMRFTPNEDLIEYHRNKWGSRKVRSAEDRFRKYLESRQEELNARERLCRSPARQCAGGERGHSDSSAPAGGGAGGTHCTTTSALESGDRESSTEMSVVPPFLKDGTPVYRDAVSHAIGAPHMDSRIAFMSLSFGVANDIDHGSEHLRWMGNARFTLYGAYVLMKGVNTYEATIRYLPWVGKNGFTLEKLRKTDKMPDPSQFPRCTMRADCPHCLEYPPPDPLRAMSEARHRAASYPVMRADVAGEESEDDERAAAARARDRRRCQRMQRSMRRFQAEERDALDAAAVAAASDHVMMGEAEVDFDDATLPWVEVRGRIYSLLICSLRDVGQDMMMAPLSHMNDGAIDLVFSLLDPTAGKGGRKEFFQFFNSLETGEHVNQWFCNYVKARAVEVKVDGGISMSDGELMPLSKVRLTKLRSAIHMVRTE